MAKKPPAKLQEKTYEICINGEYTFFETVTCTRIAFGEWVKFYRGSQLITAIPAHYILYIKLEGKVVEKVAQKPSIGVITPFKRNQ